MPQSRQVAPSSRSVSSPPSSQGDSGFQQPAGNAAYAASHLDVSAQEVDAEEVQPGGNLLSFLEGESNDKAAPTGKSPAPKGLADGVHFFPGENRLLHVVGGVVKASYEAKGGPPVSGQDDSGNEKGPTEAGDYTLDTPAPYRTPTYAWSKIAWGTALKDRSSDVWYELKSGKWGSVEKDLGIPRKDIVAYHEQLYGDAKVPSTWLFNDFGQTAFRYYADKNKNGKRDEATENLEGEMIHTTPGDEANTKQGREVQLTYSHGCVHIKPADRDALVKSGALSAGKAFVVHKYEEKGP